MNYFIFILLTICSHSLKENNIRNQLLIHHVGQGQWNVYNDGETCWHFDQGGEWASVNLIRSFCVQRNHKVFISHTDLDHLNFNQAWSHLQSKPFCFLGIPEPFPKKLKFLTAKNLCKLEALPFEILIPNSSAIGAKRGKKRLVANNFSRAIYIPNFLFYSGDAPKKIEREFVARNKLEKIKVLILGHHGSKTSTDELLLDTLKPDIAIASCRRKKYGHPHFSTLSRLRKKRVPSLTTENWGSIIIEKN